MMNGDEQLPNREVYTLKEARRYLRISDATARRWIKQGRLPARKVGRDYRILGRDIEDCLRGEQPPDGVRELRPSYPGHPLLALAGIGDSGRTDIADQHDRYLAKWLRAESRNG